MRRDKGLLAVFVILALFGIMATGGFLQPLVPIGGVPDEALRFESLEQGNYSGHAERGQYIVTNATEWGNVWAKAHPESSRLPPVDLSKEFVIAVFQGNEPSGGYMIQVEAVAFNLLSKRLKIFVKETSPGPGCAVSESFTQPFHIIKVQKIGNVSLLGRNVEFKFEGEVTACSRGANSGTNRLF